MFVLGCFAHQMMKNMCRGGLLEGEHHYTEEEAQQTVNNLEDEYSDGIDSYDDKTLMEKASALLQAEQRYRILHRFDAANAHRKQEREAGTEIFLEKGELCDPLKKRIKYNCADGLMCQSVFGTDRYKCLNW